MLISKEKWDTYFIVSIICNKANYERILDYILTNDSDSIYLFLSQLLSKNPEIYKIIQEKREDYIIEHEKLLQENLAAFNQQNRDENYSQNRYVKYFSRLSKGDYNILFDYEYQKSDLNKFITDLDKSKIQNFILTKVFKKLDIPKHVDCFDTSLNILKELDNSNTKKLLADYRTKLINCIIFYRDYDYLESILGKITTEEIVELKSFFSINKPNFQEYRTKYFYKFLNRINSNVEKGELKEIIKDDKKDFSLRLIALELFAKDYLELPFLEYLLHNYGVKIKTNDLECMFIYEVAKVLVRNDSDVAIKWLIDNILINKYEHKRNENSTHVLSSVLPQEGIGRGLVFIKSFKYFSPLLELIKDGIIMMNKNHGYYEYVNREMWDGFVEYCSKLEINEKNYLDIRNQLKEILEINKESWGINWFKYKIDTILLNLKNKVTIQNVNISSTIQKYEEINKKKYLNISFSTDVLESIIEIIDKDIPSEIRKGNFNYLLTNKDVTKSEDFYEKFLSKEIELNLLKKGFRKNDIQQIEPKIYRQIQGQNDDRTDLLVTYGSIGSVLIELKKHNNKIDQQYKDGKLKSYMEITGADYCICLIINDKMKTINFNKKIETYTNLLDDDVYKIRGINFVV